MPKWYGQLWACSILPGICPNRRTGCQLSAFWVWTVRPRTVGPRGPTVRGPTVRFLKADSWAQLSTFSRWTIGPRTVGSWGRNPPTDIYPPIVGRIYPIPVCKFNWYVFPECWQLIFNMNMKNMLLTLLCITSTELYSQNFGSLYPIQIYITKCTFPNPAHKSSNWHTFFLIVGQIYPIQIYISSNIYICIPIWLRNTCQLYL